MAAQSPSHSPLLIRVRALTGYRRLVAELNGDADALLREAGVAPQLLDDDEATLPVAQLAALLTLAARRLACADFGLRLAAWQDINVLGTVAMIALHSATVAEALDGIARHLPYHSPGASLTLADDAARGLTALRYSLDVAEEAHRRQTIELSYRVAYGFLRSVSDAGAQGWHMHFQHAQGLDAAAYARYFDCPVRLGQPRDQLLFPTVLLARPIDDAGGQLRQTAERFVGNIMRRFPLDIGRQVETLVDRQLAIGGGTIERIAGQLGLHRRTLHRRLAEQGLVFETIVDGVRRTRASEYLAQRAIPLTQVAALLGYSEQSSLNRACLRWFGQTPQQRRRDAAR